MKKIIPILIIFTGIACSPKVQPVTVTTNFEEEVSQQLVMATLWHHTSAEMVASYLQAYRYGELMLDAKLDTVSLRKPAAVVLDIDETVLDNSPYQVDLIKNQMQYGSATWKQWTDQASAEALPGALDFVNYAKSRGVQVFYISNRREDELSATISNLRVHGFPNAEERFVLLRTTTSDKTERRQQVESAYEVLVYVGDNLADYDEKYSNRGDNYGRELVIINKEELLSNFVILPNPMYGEWERAIYDNRTVISPEEKLRKRAEALEE